MTGGQLTDAQRRLLYTVSLWLRRAMLLAAVSLAVTFAPGLWWQLLATMAAALAVGMLPPVERRMALWACAPWLRAEDVQASITIQEETRS